MRSGVPCTACWSIISARRWSVCIPVVPPTFKKSSWPGASASAVRRGNRPGGSARGGGRSCRCPCSSILARTIPMDLGLTEAQELLKTSVADFVQREYDKNTLLALERSPTGVTPDLLRKVAALGWLGVVVPEAYGGGGRALTDAAGLFEELGRGPVPRPL